MIQKIGGFFGEMWQELKKVTWPARSEVLQAGMVVVIATAFLTVLIFVIDIGNSSLLSALIRRS